MKIPIITALGGAPWEAELISALESNASLSVVRRCVDVVELLAVAGAGQGRAALVAVQLRHLDVDAVDRLRAAGVVPIGVLARGDDNAEQRLGVLGIRHVVPADADPDVIASVVASAVEAGVGPGSERAFGNPATATASVIAPTGFDVPVRAPTRRGSVVAVWGPTGAPGRTTVAVGIADELSRLRRSALLVDADVYGGVIAAVLGLLDESPGLAAACRAASATRLDAAALAGLAWQLGENLRVLTGIPRAERWPELRASAMESVLAAARGLAEFTVVDCGFAVEADEEISFDTLAPRRNGATLAVLAQADVILAVGTADPIGVQRLVRALDELRQAQVEQPVWVVMNRVRGGVLPGNPERELAAAMHRFAGRTPAAFLPLDQAALDQALVAGNTLAEARPASKLRRALVELAVAISGDSPGSPGQLPADGEPGVQAIRGRRRRAR